MFGGNGRGQRSKSPKRAFTVQANRRSKSPTARPAPAPARPAPAARKFNPSGLGEGVFANRLNRNPNKGLASLAGSMMSLDTGKNSRVGRVKNLLGDSASSVASSVSGFRNQRAQRNQRNQRRSINSGVKAMSIDGGSSVTGYSESPSIASSVASSVASRSEDQCSLEQNYTHGLPTKDTCVSRPGGNKKMKFNKTSSGSYKKVYIGERNGNLETKYVVANGQYFGEIKHEIDIQRDLSSTGVVPRIVGDPVEYQLEGKENCIQIVSENVMMMNGGDSQTLGYLAKTRKIDLNGILLVNDFAKFEQNIESHLQTEQAKKFYNMAYTVLNFMRYQYANTPKAISDSAYKNYVKSIFNSLAILNTGQARQYAHKWCRDRPAIMATLKAMHEMHRKGYVHCDIKDDNVFYSMKTGKATIIDFGLARKFEDHAEQRKQAYMSTPMPKGPDERNIFDNFLRKLIAISYNVGGNSVTMREATTVNQGQVYGLLLIRSLFNNMFPPIINMVWHSVGVVRAGLDSKKVVNGVLQDSFYNDTLRYMDGVLVGMNLYAEMVYGIDDAYHFAVTGKNRAPLPFYL